MPLEFNSITHGRIAFGFFNIESDMLLLENYFFFATEYCKWISKFCEHRDQENFSDSWKVYYINDYEKIGNVMGAIHGIDHRGFIGELYKKYPFPRQPDDFKQHTDGDATQFIVRKIIEKYADQIEITFRIKLSEDAVYMGDTGFSKEEFSQLLHYVWLGGYPRWREGKRPGYVLSMKKAIEQSGNTFFHDFIFTE